MPPKKDKKKKGNKPFRYSKKGPDPYHAQLSFIREQAHNNQVNELVKQVNAAQSFAKRAREDTLNEIFQDYSAMDASPSPADPPIHADNKGKKLPAPPLQGPAQFVRNLGDSRKAKLRRERMFEDDSPSTLEFEMRYRMSNRMGHEEPGSPVGRWEHGRLGRVISNIPTAMESQPSPADAQVASVIVNNAPPALAETMLGMTRDRAMRVVNATNPHPLYRTVTGGVYPPVPNPENQHKALRAGDVYEKELTRRKRGDPLMNMGAMGGTLTEGPTRRVRGAEESTRNPRQRNQATETYDSAVSSGFQRAPRQDTQLEYNPATRDNKSRRVQQGSSSSAPMGSESRFANIPR